MDIQKIEKILKDKGEPKYRLNQITQAFFRQGADSFFGIFDLPEDLRKFLEENLAILSFVVLKIEKTPDGKCFKALLELGDREKIETVLISTMKGSWSVCVSTQVGCPLGCAFCATGKIGFRRNLTAEEITDQVLFWKQYLKKNLKFKISNLKLSNVVYMGMGEPLLNWEEVKKSLKILNDKKLFNLGARSLSISTVGILGGIQKMAEEFGQVNLAISLHFADDDKRIRFMPIGKKIRLADLKKELEKYFQKSNRKVFLEYILLENINDTDQDIQKLVNFIKSFKKQHLLHVNLISYNGSDDKFRRSSREKTLKFKNRLLRNKINVTIRKSLGLEISAACGQLAGNKDIRHKI